MAVAIRAITRIVDADDAPALGAGQNGYALTYNHGAGAFDATALGGGGLLATGATTGATSQAQTFTNGIVGPSWKPASNSTTALQLQNAAGTSILNVDTTNSRVGIGTTAPGRTLEVSGDTPYIRLTNTASGGVSMEIFAGTTGIGFGTTAAAGILQIDADASVNALSVQSGRIVLGANTIISGGAQSLYLRGSTLGSAGYGIESQGYAASYGWETIISAPNKAAGAHIDAILATNGGKVGIGTAAPASLLHTSLQDATTNAVTTVVTIGHNSTGTAAAGFGAGLALTLASSTTASQSAALMTASWIVATHASRTARLALSAYDYGGAREGLRIDSNGSAPLLGFYGHAATAQQVLATGAGATVDNVISALQALGLVKQA